MSLNSTCRLVELQSVLLKAPMAHGGAPCLIKIKPPPSCDKPATQCHDDDIQDKQSGRQEKGSRNQVHMLLVPS